MNKTVIIVAGGTGSRMGGTVPKQFMLLNSYPVLMHTLKRFYEYDKKAEIILALPENQLSQWNKLVKYYSFALPHRLVAGGMSRFHSVKNSLDLVKDHCLVGIHDGVRPLCTPALIGRCFDSAFLNTNGIPAIPVTDSLREVKNENNATVDRDKYRMIQTPQCFDSILLKKAYDKKHTEDYSDDACVFESLGIKINIVEGERSNLKITVPSDLIVASALEKELFQPMNESHH